MTFWDIFWLLEWKQLKTSTIINAKDGDYNKWNQVKFIKKWRRSVEILVGEKIQLPCFAVSLISIITRVYWVLGRHQIYIFPYKVSLEDILKS